MAYGTRYMRRHGPDAPTPRFIWWLIQLEWKITTKEGKRQMKWALAKRGIKIVDGDAA
jgi:hypothetical protein